MTALTDTITTKKAAPEALKNDDVLRLILDRVRTAASIRVQWLRKIWTEAGAATTGNLQHTEIDGYLNNIDDPDGEAEWRRNDESVRQMIERLNEIDNKLAKDKNSRLYKLLQVFLMEEAEIDILHTCLAFAMDINLGRVFAFLHDHQSRNYVSVQLVSRLFGPLHNSILPMPTLLRWRLIEQLDMGRNEPVLLQCDTFVRDWLTGISELDYHIKPFASIQPRYEPLPHWPVDETIKSIGLLFSMDEETSTRILVTGAKGSGRKTFAAAVSRNLGLGLLTVDVEKLTDQQWPLIYLYAQRQAYLDQYAVLWKGAIGKTWPSSEPSFPIQFLVGEVDETFPPAEDSIDFKLELPPLRPSNALLLWKKYVSGAANWPETELRDMVSRRSSTIGQIMGAARRGVSNLKEASASLKEGAREYLGSLAHPLNADFSWDDLVLSDNLKKTLEDFCFEATDRSALWQTPGPRRLFPQGRGLIALFTGLPGTGKTMASQVIANTIQLDLFRIDLSTVVSKYVGETSKNIERILSRASSMDVVLLFDEADALFGKRTEIKDAHDRFANSDTNYLLQAIEEYNGIVILASNRKANIDGGFMRRLRYVLDFPRPDVEQRYSLWTRNLKELVGIGIARTLDKDVRRLAELLEVTGAQIKMALLSALFMSRRDDKPMKTSYVLRGLERELAKEGRGLGRQVTESFKSAYND